MGHAGANHHASAKNTALMQVPGSTILLYATLNRTRMHNPKNPLRINPQIVAGSDITRTTHMQIKPSRTTGSKWFMESGYGARVSPSQSAGNGWYTAWG